jgi:hypothetical protein
MVSLPEARPRVILQIQAPKADKLCITKCPLFAGHPVPHQLLYFNPILKPDRDGPSISNATEACRIF